jgi:serine/threonine-protein kinase RsbW
MKKRTLKLKTLPDNIHRLEKFVEEICDEYNINNTYFGNILVALTEAVENAMFHGNLSDPEKNVIVCFDSQPKGLSFEVTDEGAGFDFNNIPDATDIDGNPDKKGAGIFLMRSVADEMEYKNNGKTARLMFYISSINQQMAIDRMNQLKSFKKAGKEIKENRQQ